jgi:hypothetical protein
VFASDGTRFWIFLELPAALPLLAPLSVIIFIELLLFAKIAITTEITGLIEHSSPFIGSQITPDLEQSKV